MKNIYQFTSFAYQKHGLFWQRKLNSHARLTRTLAGQDNNIIHVNFGSKKC